MHFLILQLFHILQKSYMLSFSSPDLKVDGWAPSAYTKTLHICPYYSVYAIRSLSICSYNSIDATAEVKAMQSHLKISTMPSGRGYTDIVLILQIPRKVVPKNITSLPSAFRFSCS